MPLRVPLVGEVSTVQDVMVSPPTGSAARVRLTGVFCAVLALTLKAVGGSTAVITVRSKTSWLEKNPSLIVIVIVAVPVWAAAGAIVISPFPPSPLSVKVTLILPSGTMV